MQMKSMTTSIITHKQQRSIDLRESRTSHKHVDMNNWQKPITELQFPSEPRH